MVLSFVDWIKNLFSEGIKFDNVPTLIFGIIIGFLFSLLAYLIFLFASFKKNERIAEKTKVVLDSEVINSIANNAKNKYLEETTSKLSVQKFTYIGELALEIITDIASKYYPDSKHPIFELSIEELFILNHYITDRIESMFTGVVLKKIKKMKVSTFLNLIDMKKKYDQAKIVKAANKAKLPQLFKSTLAVLNAVNPVYWMKKVLLDAPIVVATNKIALTILDIVATETNKVYSKNVFEHENEEIEKTVLEIEEMLGKENTNESK